MVTKLRAAFALYTQRSIPSAPLAMLRVLFGSIMVVSCVRFIALGWIEEQYVQPVMHFPYYGFEWVVSLGSPGMYIMFGVMTCAAAFIAIGFLYRFSAVTFFLCFTYIELIDKTYYLNHYYFVSIVAFLFCLVPAHSCLSVDSLLRPSVSRDRVPQWTLDIFKLQIGIVYFFAGIAKMNGPWLIDAMPLRIWLPAHTDIPVIGPLLALPWVPWVFSWTGMLYDVSVPFLLANKRTQLVAYIAVIVFHGVTGLLFQIGVFPIVMIGMTLVFFLPQGMSAQAAEDVSRGRTSLLVPRFLVVFFVLQVLIPFRFLLYPGELFWTEEGYRFSWRVMLMEKAGTATFTVEDRVTGRRGLVENSAFLNAHQEKQMAMQPDMILQFAHFLHHHYSALGITDPKVTADVWVTLNGEPSKQLIDPERDLSRERQGFHRYDWILQR